MNWEQIATNHTQERILRAKVLGGWIIKSVYRINDNYHPEFGSSLTFMPDANHEWKPEEFNKN